MGCIHENDIYLKFIMLLKPILRGVNIMSVQNRPAIIRTEFWLIMVEKRTF